MRRESRRFSGQRVVELNFGHCLVNVTLKPVIIDVSVPFMVLSLFKFCLFLLSFLYFPAEDYTAVNYSGFIKIIGDFAGENAATHFDDAVQIPE